MNKRDFLKKLSIAGATSIVPISMRASAPETLALKRPIHRMLGRTGIKVPVISSGRVSLNNDNLVKALFKSGIKLFDSGLVYADGKNDAKLGEMVKVFGRKNNVICSKVMLDYDLKEKKFRSGDIQEEFEKKLNQILSCMKEEYLDILFIHDARCSDQVNHPDVLAAMEKAKKVGKARFLGVSSHENVTEVVGAACDAKIYDVVLMSYNYRSGQDVKDAFARASKGGLGTIAMKSMAGYWVDKEKTIPVNKSAAMKYILQDENVHTVIKSFSSFDDISLFTSLMYDLKMTEKEKSDIELTRQYAGLYCIGCGLCRPLCPKGLSVPDLMRGYMYTYGYGEPSRGRSLVLKNGITETTCIDCVICMVKCSMGFPVNDRIRDIARLRNISDDFLA